MCGIFGYIDQEGKRSGKHLEKIFSKLAKLSETRGKEASGIALYHQGQVKVIRVPEPSSYLVKTKEFKSLWNNQTNSGMAQGFIGHTRLVTDGYEHDDNNNQPVLRDGWVVVHNGIITNKKALWNSLAPKKPFSDLDTELLPLLLNKWLRLTNDDLNTTIQRVFEEIYGTASIACFDEQGGKLLLATNNGSLYYRVTPNRSNLLFGSEKYIVDSMITENPELLHSFNGIETVQINPRQYVALKIHNGIPDLSQAKSTIEHKQHLKVWQPITLKVEAIDKNKYTNTSFEYKKSKIPLSFEKHFERVKMEISQLKKCTKCLLPSTFPFITFDNEGVCNYCHNYHPNNYKGQNEFNQLVTSYKKGKGSPDCLLPFSGGRDSSYVIHYVVNELGMKPIAFSYDWGMITDLGRRNQARMCGKLGVEHIFVSADIRKKRDNIRKNVESWLKRPNLGTIPLFMAGDKQYFKYSNLLLKNNGLKLSILGENLLETTNFKSGFCGIKPRFGMERTYAISNTDKIKMALFYLKEFIANPYYLNSSLVDTMSAFKSYYIMEHKSINMFNYIKWDEKKIMDVLRSEYDWEMAEDTTASWRIGDGTASFYNYIYFIVAGFTENDTFRSNQIREGDLSRYEALKMTEKENEARWDSLQWYCNTIKIDFESTIVKINNIKPLYV